MFTYTHELFHNHTIALIVNYVTIGDVLLPLGRTTYATVRREKATPPIIIIIIDCTKLAIAIFPRSYKLQFHSYKDLKKDEMRYVILTK